MWNVWYKVNFFFEPDYELDTTQLRFELNITQLGFLFSISLQLQNNEPIVLLNYN